MPLSVFVTLLEGKAHFKGCVKFSLPSSDVTARASPDLKKRLLAIESVDLRKDTLGFEVAGVGGGCICVFACL